MTMKGLVAALNSGDAIIVIGRSGEHELLRVPGSGLRYGRSGAGARHSSSLRRQLRALIAFRKEGKKK
jgi:hypothetical protein